MASVTYVGEGSMLVEGETDDTATQTEESGGVEFGGSEVHID